MNNGTLAPIDAGLMDLEKDQRLSYLHNYESAYLPKFQEAANNEQQLVDKEAYLDYEAGHQHRREDFLELDYDRLNAAGLLIDDRDDYYEHEPPPPQPREHYMLPTEHQQQQQSSMFNPQFLPNFNDMMRLVARYESGTAEQQSKFYPNESDEYQEIVGENERLAYRPPPPGFPNRSSLELSRVERADDFVQSGPQKTQTTGRRGGKPKFNARNDANNFLS